LFLIKKKLLTALHWPSGLCPNSLLRPLLIRQLPDFPPDSGSQSSRLSALWAVGFLFSLSFFFSLCLSFLFSPWGWLLFILQGWCFLKYFLHCRLAAYCLAFLFPVLPGLLCQLLSSPRLIPCLETPSPRRNPSVLSTHSRRSSHCPKAPCSLLSLQPSTTSPRAGQSWEAHQEDAGPGPPGFAQASPEAPSATEALPGEELLVC